MSRRPPWRRSLAADFPILGRLVPKLAADPMSLGAVAEFASPEELVTAARTMRERGYRRLDAYTPYPVEALEEVLEIPRTRLPAAVLACALLGAVVGYGVQWLTNTILYPLDVGGRPLHPVLSFLVIAFETAVLFGGTAAFVGFLLAGRLPEPWNPLFEVDGFERASADRFWLGVDERDERFVADVTRYDLLATGALRVVRLDGRGPVAESRGGWTGRSGGTVRQGEGPPSGGGRRGGSEAPVGGEAADGGETAGGGERAGGARGGDGGPEGAA